MNAVYSSRSLRLITWNCGGAFRNKYQAISELNPDICIIQECEDPASVTDLLFDNWCSDFRWTGNNPNKGLAVFALNGRKLSGPFWNTDDLKFFLPCRIDTNISVVGVWACRAAGKQESYIGQVWKFVQRYSAELADSNVIIAGDFNSNKIWDAERPCGNHSDVVNLLGDMKISSVYHATRDESHGSESLPTFHMYRHQDKPFHIDYIFASRNVLEQTTEFEIGAASKWLRLSDHLPICIDIQIDDQSY